MTLRPETAVRSRRARPRPRARLAALLSLVAATTASCGAVDFLNEIGEPQLDLARMESDIRSDLQRDLESRLRSTRGSVASVGRVRCRQRTDVSADCFARYTRPSGSRLRKLAVSVDPETGGYRYELVR